MYYIIYCNNVICNIMYYVLNINYKKSNKQSHKKAEYDYEFQKSINMCKEIELI